MKPIHDPMPRELALPAYSPDDIDDFLAFIDRMHVTTRQLRDTSALPRAAMTLPDQFDAVLDETLPMMAAQAAAARAAGREQVAIRLPMTDALADLVRWVHERWDLMTGLVRAGLVDPSWRRPLSIWVSLMTAALGQIPEAATSPETRPDAG